MIRAVVVVGIIAALAYGAYYAYQQALTTPSLALQRVVLHQVPTPLIEQVRERITPYYGENLLALDLEQLQLSVEEIPEVRSASVRRTLPDGLVVRVEPRQPRAVLRSADGTCVIDREGVVISAPEVSRRKLMTVLMENVDLYPRRGQSLIHMAETGRSIGGALTALEWLDASGKGTALGVDHLRLDTEGIVIVLSQSGIEILLGDAESLAEKVEAVEALLLADRPDGPAVVDARYQDMLVVRDLPQKEESSEERE
jgi:cell division septal protein FtsQ